MNRIQVKRLGICPYFPVWREMQCYTTARNACSTDQIWLLQHQPVYTLGMAAKDTPLPADGNIPVVHSDRGGQITYHAPGQLLAYLLLDLGRYKLRAKEYVHMLEAIIIDVLAHWSVVAQRRPGAPGVYLEDAKIAAIGIRIRRNYCYHGIAINVNMNMSPWQSIDPCGYQGLAVTQLAEHVAGITVSQVASYLQQHILVTLADRESIPDAPIAVQAVP